MRPLANALASRAVSCWLDEAVIQPGMSIIDAISDGIRKAHFVVVFFTENLARNWPQTELNAAMWREIESGQVVVLPILIMDRTSYMERYPLLAPKLYLPWTDGIDVIAERIARQFYRQPAAEWDCQHPSDYIGIIWTRVTPAVAHQGEPHVVTLRWGPYWVTITLTSGQTRGPISLIHHKTKQDNVPLLVSVDPPAIVTCGQGPAPDSVTQNIDEGWQRTAGGSWPGHL